jgi:hypothetical protein
MNARNKEGSFGLFEKQELWNSPLVLGRQKESDFKINSM